MDGAGDRGEGLEEAAGVYWISGAGSRATDAEWRSCPRWKCDLQLNGNRTASFGGGSGGQASASGLDHHAFPPRKGKVTARWRRKETGLAANTRQAAALP